LLGGIGYALNSSVDEIWVYDPRPAVAATGWVVE
jgi:hypothetical protein